ncbi:MAG: hypothetical protein CMI74_04025 [Candidatus Pelagibacter sp.]|nr:hypothetical protein [Candidatus Pelagibacter sp.]|tara:strand:- start:7896 stop:9620 length:1725 start_codon:yes stop_codon:yes gene_type:complete
MATAQDFYNYRMTGQFPPSIYSPRDDATMRRIREKAFLNKYSASRNTPEMIAARVQDQKDKRMEADSFRSAQENIDDRQYLRDATQSQSMLANRGILGLTPQNNTLPDLPDSMYEAGSLTGDVIVNLGKGIYGLAEKVTPPILDTFADVTEGVRDFGMGALDMEQMPEGPRFREGDDFNPFNYKGAIKYIRDKFGNIIAEEDTGAVSDVELANGGIRTIPDMDGAGVLRRPDQLEEVAEEINENLNPVTTMPTNDGVLTERTIEEKTPEGTTIVTEETVSETGGKEGVLGAIGDAAGKLVLEGSTTGNKRNNTTMNIPRTSLAEKLIRMGGAVMGASEKGGLAAMQAGTSAYGALRDEDRRLAQQERENQLAELEAIQRMTAPTAATAKQLENQAETKKAAQMAYDDASNFDFLATQLEAAGDNVTGFYDGIIQKTVDDMRGHPRSLLRLGLQNAKVQAALKNVAQTKGAISNREMELFLSPLPSLVKNQEHVWIAWLKLQSALAKRTGARLSDQSNLNPDGSLINRVDLDSGTSDEIEALYSDYINAVKTADNKGSSTQISQEDQDAVNFANQ